jgi:hypothetical protein
MLNEGGNVQMLKIVDNPRILHGNPKNECIASNLSNYLKTVKLMEK